MIDQSNRAVYTHPGPSGGYPDAMSYMMDGQAQMMHRPPEAGFHQGYHYPPAEYYGHHFNEDEDKGKKYNNNIKKAPLLVATLFVI
uniref:CSON009226 protein n=1 Tax=Culicoides sonorensis TaxID=179676 RepID=A0A336M577_CULSO